MTDSPSVIEVVHAATSRHRRKQIDRCRPEYDSPSVIVVEGVACSDKQLLSHGCNVGAGAHELH